MMRNLDALLTRYFGFTAAAVSFALLVAAHSFEMFAGLTPCAMCMNQRAVHWAAVGAGLVIGLAGGARPRVRRIGLWILALVYLFGAALGFYHVALEHHWVAEHVCGVSRAGWPFDPALSWVMEHVATPFGYHKQTLSEKVTALLSGTGTKGVTMVGSGAPRCDTPVWWFAGLTMAGWNALISLLMVFLAARAALWKGGRR